MKRKQPRYYTGIGARKTPDNVLPAMTGIARGLDSLGFTLRSGGAPGADTAFERGSTQKEIFLPWKNFNNNPSSFIEPADLAVSLSRKMFPHFPGVSRSSRLLISRNMHQLFGPEIMTSPVSEFVICWTENGKATGGTGYAIKTAKRFGIPVYNLFDDMDCIKLRIMIYDMHKENVNGLS